MSNPYKRLLGLLPQEPLDIGTVTAVHADGVTVELVSGAQVRVRGDAEVGARVWVRAGVIEGPAPAHEPTEIEVGGWAQHINNVRLTSDGDYRVTYNGADYLAIHITTGTNVWSQNNRFVGRGVGTFQVVDNADLTLITPIESTQDANTALWFNNSLVWSLANTVVDTNGFIKQASPVLRLYRDRIEPNHEVPSTAEFFRFGPGHYVITGTPGLAQAGWCYEAPRDGHGSLLVFTNIEQSPDGTIVVNTYRPEYETGRLVPGEPMDIPAHRWVDIRLHAPEPAPED